MKISEAQTLVKKLAKEFDKKYRKMKERSTPQLYFIDMVETLGELGGTLKVREFWHKTPEFYHTQPKENLENKLVDFLYDILMIASIYNVNLEKAFSSRMQQFQKKFLQGSS